MPTSCENVRREGGDDRIDPLGAKRTREVTVENLGSQVVVVQLTERGTRRATIGHEAHARGDAERTTIGSAAHHRLQPPVRN